VLRLVAVNLKIFTSLIFSTSIKRFSGRKRKIAGGVLIGKALNE